MEEKKSIFEKLRLVDRIEKVDKTEKDNNKQEKNNKGTYINEEEQNNKASYINKEENKEENSVEKEVESIDRENSKSSIENKAISKNKPLTVEQIYERFKVGNINGNNVFLIDSYLKALPENLPTDVKRQSVLNIIKVSKMNIEDLIRDGENRLDILNSYTKEVAKETEYIIKEYEAKIQELYKKIDEYKKIISERGIFQEEQKAYIDYETQKIENIIKFVK
ncbi:hypothetical protein [Clostridium sp.]|uniref:hypothetical protein n=1 Tax=Clostridium sp. TaxID=1506 RepID=UPI0039F58587